MIVHVMCNFLQELDDDRSRANSDNAFDIFQKEAKVRSRVSVHTPLQ